MSIQSLPFATDRFLAIAKLWVEPVNRGECNSIIGMNSREQLYRIPQLITGGFIRQELKSNGVVVHLDLLQKPIEDDTGLNNYVARLIDTYDNAFICIIVSNADVLLHYPFALERFNTITHETDRVRFIFVFQRNITSPGLLKRLSKYTHILQNTVVHPLFASDDINHFIRYKCSEFGVSPNESLIKQIRSKCGNEMWLITECLRYFAKTGDVKNLFSHQEIVWRVETLLTELEPEERLILKSVVKKEPVPADNQSVIYLIRRGYLSENRQTITVPLIAERLASKLRKEIPRLKNRDKRLFIDAQDSTHLFTDREQQGLLYFLLNENVLITRNNLQVAIWGEEKAQEMTEWALDQQVKRIRDKLKLLKCKKCEISTVKKQGFIFRQP